MRRKPFIAVGGLLLIAAVMYFAIGFRTSSPVLVITRTSFPSCVTRTYTITQSDLTVSQQGRRLTRTAVSPALLAAVSDPALASLDSLYDEPSTADGFELEFRFGVLGPDKIVTVRNRYVPGLYRILEQCNRLLPPSARFSEKERFNFMNRLLQSKIEDFRVRKDLPEQLRSNAISEFERLLISIEN